MSTVYNTAYGDDFGLDFLLLYAGIMMGFENV